MKEILVAMMLWLSANTSYNINHPLPTVKFMPQTELNSMFYSGEIPKGNHLYGMYSLEEDTIILPDTWNPNEAWDMGVLLHELVHYVQDVNEIKFDCVAQMEKDSWPLQKEYLKEVHDYVWDYDPMWYMVISTCSDPFNY